MNKLAMLCAVIVGAALMSGAPFSLRFSSDRTLWLSMDTATARMPGGGVPKPRDLGCRYVRGVRVC
jgi:hypothetical protein